MEPTLPDGSAIVVDRNRSRLREGRIYVVRTDDGLLVKRVKRDSGGEWRLISDNPDWDPVSWPVAAKVYGEVKWVAKPL